MIQFCGGVAVSAFRADGQGLTTGSLSVDLLLGTGETLCGNKVVDRFFRLFVTSQFGLSNPIVRQVRPGGGEPLPSGHVEAVQLGSYHYGEAVTKGAGQRRIGLDG